MNNRSLLNKLILFGGVFMLGLSVWAKDGMVIIRYEAGGSMAYNKQTKEGDLITWSESESKEEIRREITELWVDGKLKKRKAKNLPQRRRLDSTVHNMKIDREKGEITILLDDVPTAMKARFSGDNFTINVEEYKEYIDHLTKFMFNSKKVSLSFLEKDIDHLVKSMLGPSWNTSEIAEYVMAIQIKNKYPNLAKRVRNLETKVEKPSSKFECSLKDRSCEGNFVFEMQATFKY